MVNTPFRKWTKGSEVFGDHDRFNYHLTALSQAESITTTAVQQEKSIAGYQSTRADGLDKNQKNLASLAECVAFCGQQGLAFRGHWNDATAYSSMN